MQVRVLSGYNIIKRGISKCTKTKHWSVKTAEANLPLPQANRNILLKKVCRTNLKDAGTAVQQRKIQAEAKELFIQAYALPAEKKQKFPLNPETADLFIAATVTQNLTKNNITEPQHKNCGSYFMRKVRDFHGYTS